MQSTTSSLLGILERRAEEHPSALQYRYLPRGEADEPALELTRAGLLDRARSLGAVLAEHTVPGDRVLLLYPPGLDTFAAFFACLHADVIAVPVVPPDPRRLDQTLPRLVGIATQSGAKLVVSTAAVVDAARPFLAQVPALAHLAWLASDVAIRGVAPPASPGRGAQRRSSAVAFLQYTSGSLGAPKGVVVTDAALLENLEMIRVGMVMGPSTPGVFWLPHHHDMGFIGGGLEFVYCGAPCTLMSPVAFIQRPARWLRAISRFGGVVGGGPSFAYERCARHVSDAELEGVDLGSWRVAFVGAEPVRASVLDRFARRFEPCGFRREFFYPCYGLAESTLFVTGKPMPETATHRWGSAGQRPAPPDTPGVPRELAVSTQALEQNRVELLASGEPESRALVSCGAPRLAAGVVIASLRGKTRAKPGEVGEIWISGPNLAAGYWDDAEKTRATFGVFLEDTGEGPFFATGDLGFLEDGELYVTGRAKEVMILGGRNHYPQDLEETIEASHPDLRHAGSAAFSFDRDDDEVLAVVAEVTKERIAAERAAPRTPPYHDIASAIRASLLKHHLVVPREIALIPPQGLLKTTSGKKARLDMRRRLLGDQLERA